MWEEAIISAVESSWAREHWPVSWEHRKPQCQRKAKLSFYNSVTSPAAGVGSCGCVTPPDTDRVQTGDVMKPKRPTKKLITNLSCYDSQSIIMVVWEPFLHGISEWNEWIIDDTLVVVKLFCTRSTPWFKPVLYNYYYYDTTRKQLQVVHQAGIWRGIAVWLSSLYLNSEKNMQTEWSWNQLKGSWEGLCHPSLSRCLKGCQ